MTDTRAARIAMVDCQVRPSDVTLYPIIAAMLEVPREAHVPQAMQAVAYAGTHLDLAPGRVMLDPRTTAKMLDAVNVGEGEKVLVLGSGSGYTAALLARMGAVVTAVEEDARLVALCPDVAGVTRRNGPAAAGAPGDAPFDAIFVDGAVEHLPEAVMAQLRPGGRVVAIVMEGPVGRCRLGTRAGDGLSWRNVFDASAPVLPGFEKAKEFAF